MNPRVVISVGNFFFGLFSTATVYILVPFLGQFMPEAYTGFVVAAGALVACALFPFQPRLVAKLGAQQLALIFAVLEMVALFGLAAAPGAVTACVLVAVVMALQPFLAYELDLLLEATVLEEGTTGQVRSIFLTAWNVAALASPLLMGALLDGTESYERVFLAGAAALVPFVVLFAARKLPKVLSPQISHLDETLRCIMHDRDLAAVTVNHLLLYLFFMWAPLYIPAYLHSVLGIPWNELGWMFAIMLIPYAVLQYPAGIIADRILGDQELMFAGFLIAGTALAAIGLITPATPTFLIVLLLVATRTGSALIEVMTEGHFFRRVSAKDVNSVSIFRGIWPLADLVAPALGSLILIFGSYQMLFYITGGFLAAGGVLMTLRIRDFTPRPRATTQATTAP